jgi:hypothetical protein
MAALIITDSIAAFIYFIFYHDATAPVGQGLLIAEDS